MYSIGSKVLVVETGEVYQVSNRHFGWNNQAVYQLAGYHTFRWFKESELELAQCCLVNHSHNYHHHGVTP